MIDRERLEELEIKNLSEYASKSINSSRVRPEEKCKLRTEYQRDRDRILHCKAFRRLKHKTQVFLSPQDDHYRTRLTHTLEVSQISRTIARALALNEDLTEAIALGHDLGHTPFGHSGEKYLNEKHIKGFKHNEQSLRVVDFLERNRDNDGMNLTNEVRDGILNHTGDTIPSTLEGQIVKISDRVAYINHDIDDSIRAGIIKDEDLPKECIKVLGSSHRERINNLVMDIIMNSDNKPIITMSEEMYFYKNKLRDFMFENVYYNKIVKKDAEMIKIKHIINELYDYYLVSKSELPDELYSKIDDSNLEDLVKDYIAGMTDRYAINKYTELYIPRIWK